MMKIQGMTGIRFALLGGALLFLGGCASVQSEPEAEAQTDTMRAIHAAVDEGLQQNRKAPPQPPAAVRSALMPEVNINIPGVESEQLETRFDVKVRKVEARDFFLSLVDGTPYNIVVDPKVGGTISLDLKNVTVTEVLDVVRDVYGYDFRRSGSGFHVLPNTLQTRMYQIDYLDIKRNSTSQIQARSGQVSMNASNSGTNGGNDGDTGGGTNSASGAALGSVINTQSESDFWGNLEQSLGVLVGEDEGRLVSINRPAGLVIVRAMPDELRDISRFLEAIQGAVARQVILEARIIEVELSEAFQSGINWAGLADSGSGDTVLGGQVGGANILDSGASALEGSTNLFDPNDLPAVRDTVASGFGGMFAMAVDLSDFTAFIELLKTQGQVQVLSSPRVATVNNQKAVIKVGTDEFFVTDVNTNTTTGTATTQNLNVELTPFFSGVALDVIPQISADSHVTLHIHPTVSEVSEQIKSVTTGTNNLTLPLAASTIRESDSVIRSRSGQVVVIGGLMQNSDRDQDAAVPFLGDLPILGNAFKHKRDGKTKSELVILLKATIVRGDEQWNQELERASQSLRSLGGGGARW